MSESRYSRQQRLAQIGPDGQEAIGAATVAVIGVGALGSVSADLLARAGVGKLLLVDRDVVEMSNLQRQVLYTEADATALRPKAEAAAERLAAVNSEIDLVTLPVDITAANIQELLADASLIVDGTDNFATRYLLNDFAVREAKAYVYAGVVSTHGMLGTIVPGGPCLRCTWPQPPDATTTPTCRSAGVLGPAVSVIAGWAAAEALKIASGQSEEVASGYRYLDVWTGQMQFIHAAKDDACPCCVDSNYEWLSGQHGSVDAQVVCSGDAVQLPAGNQQVDLAAMANKLDGTVTDLQCSSRFLRFRTQELDILLFMDGRALVRGTGDIARARAVVAETIGA
ncbi:MAG: thiazole biosynthesis adenylyltransferase ThiF [Planctomycetes bacterium]|nr:thiazole biosynthesis adenylyltransferase ThiF [Planctomycetota bacterium]MCP4771654.1 thiazole biosynthesis adenylyltransferase ThiF [Planctomycetota bacterium]MCP4860046.1 thiazole biosynthesis adenylyltransferase ThiF [Planctomycetota bacterium]